MALPAGVVWRATSDGSDNNGGGFVAGGSGTDYSQQAAAQFTGTNMTVDATANTKVTPDGHTPTAADVDNIIQIRSGTGWTTGFYRILSQDGVEWTLDRSPAAIGISGGVWSLGGYFATIGQAGAAHVAGNTIYFNGTQTITSASTNVAGGCLSLILATSVSSQTRLLGFNVTPGDNPTGANRPLIQTNGSITTFTFVTMNGGCQVDHIRFDGNSRTSSRGINVATAVGQIYNCKFSNMTNGAVNAIVGTQLVKCEGTGCSTVVVFNIVGMARNTTAHDNAISGFQIGTNTHISRCASINNTGASSDGFLVSSSLIGGCSDCFAYGNGRHGFNNNNSAAASGAMFNNCVSYGNAGWQYTSAAAVHQGCFLYNCATGTGGSGGVNSTQIPASQVIGLITLTADPTVNAAGGDYSYNNTPGGGALLRGAGVPSSLEGLSTLSYPDVGAVQHLDPVRNAVSGMTGGLG